MDQQIPPEWDPTLDICEWELTGRERHIWEAGFIAGYGARQPEINHANNDADRYYRAAYQNTHPKRNHW